MSETENRQDEQPIGQNHGINVKNTADNLRNINAKINKTNQGKNNKIFQPAHNSPHNAAINNVGKEKTSTDFTNRNMNESALRAGNTAASGTASAGAASGGTAAGIAGSGAAAGAAAGSAVPVAGTAIGAAVGAGASGPAKKGIQKGASDTAGVAAPVGGEIKTSAGAPDNVIVKIVMFIAAIVVAFVVLISCVLFSVVSKIAAPAFFMWELVTTGSEKISEFIDELGTEKVNYEDIVALITNKIMVACEKAYNDTCYREVYQIAIEQEYDLELTLESYNNTNFPYILSGNNCNINYAEIINVLSLSDKYINMNYTQFSYSEFCEMFSDDEFLRCLYDLDVVRAEKYIINESALTEGDSAIVDADGIVTIINSDGTTYQIFGEEAKIYYDIIIYGEVSINHYPLKKVYDYFGVDPYGVSKIIPTMTNNQSLGHLEYYTRHYYPDAYWGYAGRTELLDYKRLTGVLNTDVMNVYSKDINNYSVFSDTEVYMELEIFKQSGQYWSSEPYGQSRQSIAKIGCCLTSMAMVCNYFSDEYIDPHVLNTYITNTNHGLLNRPSVAVHYGFKQYNSSHDVNIEAMMGELSNGRLLIVHIKSGAKGTGVNGHWVVINGYLCSDTDAYFYVSEPASRLNNTISMAEAVMIFDQYQSYGR